MKSENVSSVRILALSPHLVPLTRNLDAQRQNEEPLLFLKMESPFLFPVLFFLFPLFFVPNSP